MENQKDIQKTFYIDRKFNKFGDVEKIEYFTDIDENNDSKFNLAFREKIVVARNQNTGLPLNKTTVKEQIKADEVINSETFVEHFNKSKGIEFNQNSRNNLILVASEYTINKLIETHGETQSIENATVFLDSVKTQRDKYILGIIDELITAIQNCNLQFITEEIKTGLIQILNIRY